LSESDSDCKQVFREFADAIYPGLDLWREIDAVRVASGSDRFRSFCGKTSKSV
jgi:hypothetical protein